MAQVSFTINGRRYDVACADGQEDHLRALAGQVNDKVEQMLRSVGAVEDARLMFLAALLLADELSEMRQATSPADPQPATPPGYDIDVSALEGHINHLAGRIEAVAERLRGA